MKKNLGKVIYFSNDEKIKREGLASAVRMDDGNLHWCLKSPECHTLLDVAGSVRTCLYLLFIRICLHFLYFLDWTIKCLHLDNESWKEHGRTQSYLSAFTSHYLLVSRSISPALVLKGRQIIGFILDVHV